MAINKSGKKELFFPYYINQNRLLDIYAILNDGYSEYEEITTNVSEGKTKKGEAKISANGGFKLFNIGGSASTSGEKQEGKTDENKTKKVQTVTSVLSIVQNDLKERGYLKEMIDCKPGDFVCLPVNLQINSIKAMISEISELFKLINGMKKMGVAVDMSSKDLKEIDDFIKVIKVMFDGEEIICIKDEYAIIGNITEGNLYQSTRADLIGTELTCLAQVKRVFPEGTELMKNTLIAKMGDKNAKREMIDSMKDLANDDSFSLEATAMASIEDKPVYQLEIIALYQ